MEGRFTQEDVYCGDGLNLYAYCQNNPVTWYDPSGLISETASGYYVYGLFDTGASTPCYVGISNDPKRRNTEHITSGRLNEEKGSMKIFDHDITYGESRGYEQYYIESYETKTGTIGEPISSENRGNKVNSYDHNSATRDEDRQAYFEDAYDSKKKREEERGGNDKCPT